MTPAQLKYNIEHTNDESHFFSRESMRFFGDTMANYGVRSATIVSHYNSHGEFVSIDGIEVECWELYRKRTTSKGFTASAYFAKDTFRRVFFV